MAAGDMVARLLLNSADFDNKLKKSKKGVQDFEKKGTDLGNVVSAAFKKVAVAAVSIKTAQKAWDAFFSSSQTHSDTLASTMYSLNTVTSNFVYSISNADFSPFLGGLDEMIRKSKEAYTAYDQLGNTMMATSYIQATKGSDYRSAMARARNKDLSIDERKAALEQARAAGAAIQTAADVTATNSMNALRKGIAARANIDESLITDKAIDAALSLDATKTFEQQRNELERQYSEYLGKIEKIKDDYPVTLEILFGAGSGKKGKNQKAREELISKLGAEFSDVIVAYQLLFRESDEDLAKMYETAKSAVAARNQAAEIETSTNEVGTAISKQCEELRKKNDEILKTAEETAQAYAMLHNATRLFQTGVIGPSFQPAVDLPKTIDYKENLSEPWDSKHIAEIEEMGRVLEEVDKSVNMLASSFGNLGSSIGGTVGEIFDFLGSVTQTGQTVLTLIGYIQAEKVMHDQNASSAMKEAAAKTLSAYAGIPFAGIAMGLTTVASIISTIKSIPKFAEGGIVTSATLGVFGEAGPEAVMPLDRMKEFVAPGSIEIKGEFRQRGKDLVAVIESYKQTQKVK